MAVWPISDFDQILNQEAGGFKMSGSKKITSNMTLEDSLRELLKKCSKCEYDGNCDYQEVIQLNLKFGPVDGNFRLDLE